ncbi:uncharacterized protein B0I36DRAFT_6266 [Microdochium trichocladiopsis]|uniref:Uncharacterized protein n=1 Tax=Microdochium trichocladiopsis TaxID=1682393 RepID=A0A9P8YHP3_9PEZI|nr:uncharacterized protein B0I36DRAFT_6266 [Microdochium trichocladiopsis]KAH7040143.1 hypothetical protein B0I36DRAFT_6266 [Microdochium trichocladiopsis]
MSFRVVGSFLNARLCADKLLENHVMLPLIFEGLLQAYLDLYIVGDNSPWRPTAAFKPSRTLREGLDVLDLSVPSPNAVWATFQGLAAPREPKGAACHHCGDTSHSVYPDHSRPGFLARGACLKYSSRHNFYPSAYVLEKHKIVSSPEQIRIARGSRFCVDCGGLEGRSFYTHVDQTTIRNDNMRCERCYYWWCNDGQAPSAFATSKQAESFEIHTGPGFIPSFYAVCTAKRRVRYATTLHRPSL